LVSLIRLAGIDFNPNDGATAVKWDHEFVKRAIETIASRAELVLGSKQAGDDIRNELKHRLDYWLAQAAMKTGGSRLVIRREKTVSPEVFSNSLRLALGTILLFEFAPRSRADRKSGDR